MATRRTTRRSVAAGNGIENDLAAKGTAPSLSAAAGKQGLKPVVTTRAAASKSVVVGKSATTSTTTTAGARKRSAFADVTNGTKNKANAASTSAAAKSTSTYTKPAPALASSTTARRSYRTRSSTGGSAVKLDDNGREIEDGSEQAEEDDDAMAIDPPAAAPAARQIKSLKRSAATASAPSAKSASTTTSAARRAPLASKRANTSTAASTTTTAGGNVSKATLALRARQRREAAEARQLEAQREVEEARRAEEELAHRSKKARTSEPDHYDEEEEEEEEEIEVLDEDDVEVRGEDEYFVETDAGLPKDHGWEDLDDGDEEDPLMVSAYVVEVYEYLRELELTTMPEVDYMANQNEVTWKMRGILVDWLIEIHTKFRLLPETIFLATNIIDRFLSTRVVSLVKFQLVGVTALFIAAKYEEVVCPSVSNFLYMTDGGYGDDEILKAERYVLSMIDFNLSYPNPINFLRRISKADGYDIQSRTMAKYLMEISIVDHKFMGTPPSLIAAAGNWLARRVLDKGEWDANLVHYSGYSEEELKPTAQLMLDYVVRSSPILSADAAKANQSGMNPLQTSPISHEVEHPNFIKKYAAKKFFKASTSIRKWAEEEFAPVQRYNSSTRKMEYVAVAPIL